MAFGAQGKQRVESASDSVADATITAAANCSLGGIRQCAGQ